MLRMETGPRAGGCCRSVAAPPDPDPQSLPRQTRRWEFATGALSLGVWLAMPKCPMCVAAHVTLWTGLGLSFTEAAYLRWSLLALSSAALSYLIVKRALRGRLERVTNAMNM